MVRCPFCGSSQVKNTGFDSETTDIEYGKEREIRHWKTGKPYKIRPVKRHWIKTQDRYKCGVCLRRFDSSMAKGAYLSEKEKQELISLLKRYGLDEIAQNVESKATRIHQKSTLGQLYSSLREQKEKIIE